jgi:hypothetical protein
LEFAVDIPDSERWLLIGLNKKAATKQGENDN